MKILLIQANLVWLSPEENRKHLESTILNNKNSIDLVVLPEMFTTGFCTTPQNVAEPANTVTLEWMKTIAQQKNIAIGGSVLTEEKAKFYNRFYFVKPDGSYTVYNKRHLFSFAGENNHYTAGQERIIVEYSGFKILLQICYDLRFPVFARNKNDYDLILYVANWPTQRIGAWDTLLRARAIENQCYVAGINRVGDDPACHYCGHSMLINFLGEPFYPPVKEKETAMYGELDIDNLQRFREKFPAWSDADDFEIKL